MLITIQEHLAHSSVIVRVADFFLWPLTHSELRMQISSEWILKTIWSSRQERVFLPLCESDAHKGIQTAWVLEDLAMCMFQAPGRKFQEESACSLSWCSGQELLPLQLAFCVPILYTFLFQLISPLISSLQRSLYFFILLPFYWLIQASSKYLLAYQTQRTMTTTACVYWVLGERMQTGYQNSALASPQ